MADHKDYKAIIEELPRQGWVVEMTARGHYRAIPPNKELEMVHFSTSEDHHALRNIIRDLRRRGFVWPPPNKKEIAVERRLEAETRPSQPDVGTIDDIEPLDTETPEARMDRLFTELKDAKVLAALTEEHAQECRRKVEEATRVLTDAVRERDAAAQALKNKKAEFDLAFEAAA
jgi:hypothetical protein